MPTTYTLERLAELEKNREPVKRDPTRDLGSYTKPELLSMLLQVPLSEFQAAVLQHNKEVLQRAEALVALRRRVIEALDAEDYETAARLRSERADRHIETLLWMGRLFNAADREARARDRAETQRAAKEAVRRMPRNYR